MSLLCFIMKKKSKANTIQQQGKNETTVTVIKANINSLLIKGYNKVDKT